MCAEGVPVTQPAAELGHAKTSLTLDVYGQRSHELKRPSRCGPGVA
jgi:hypothetical protein